MCACEQLSEKAGDSVLGRPAVSPTVVSWWLSMQGHLAHSTLNLRSHGPWMGFHSPFSAKLIEGPLHSPRNNCDACGHIVWLPAPYDQAREGPQTICHTCLSMKVASHLGLSLTSVEVPYLPPFPTAFSNTTSIAEVGPCVSPVASAPGSRLLPRTFQNTSESLLQANPPTVLPASLSYTL